MRTRSLCEPLASANLLACEPVVFKPQLAPLGYRCHAALSSTHRVSVCIFCFSVSPNSSCSRSLSLSLARSSTRLLSLLFVVSSASRALPECGEEVAPSLRPVCPSVIFRLSRRVDFWRADTRVAGQLSAPGSAKVVHCAAAAPCRTSISLLKGSSSMSIGPSRPRYLSAANIARVRESDARFSRVFFSLFSAPKRPRLWPQ